MAKPPIQVLQKGKFLCAKNFPSFVDTFNYALSRIENLKGDQDANPKGGRITVDVTDPEHPIIRYHDPKEDEKNKIRIEEVCEIDWDEKKIKNIYIQVEQILYTETDLPFTPVSRGFLLLTIDATSAISVKTVSDVAEFNELACNIKNHVVPLCYMEDDTYGHRRVIDMRAIPHAQSWMGVSPM